MHQTIKVLQSTQLYNTSITECTGYSWLSTQKLGDFNLP
jgi:hypothetical protein